MADSPVSDRQVADLTAEVDTLRARVRDLESQLKSREPSRGTAPSSSQSNGPLKTVAALLGILVVLMIPPTIITTRRIIRWWQS